MALVIYFRRKCRKSDTSGKILNIILSHHETNDFLFIKKNSKKKLKNIFKKFNYFPKYQKGKQNISVLQDYKVLSKMQIVEDENRSLLSRII